MAVGDKLVTLDGLKAVYQDVNGNIVDLKSHVNTENNVLRIGETTPIEWLIEKDVGVKAADGTDVSSSVFSATNYIDVRAFDRITYKRHIVTGTVNTGIAFYDDTKTFIDNSGILGIPNGSERGVQDNTVAVPSGACYVRCTVWRDQAEYGAFEISGKSKLSGIFDQLGNLIYGSPYGVQPYQMSLFKPTTNLFAGEFSYYRNHRYYDSGTDGKLLIKATQSYNGWLIRVKPGVTYTLGPVDFRIKIFSANLDLLETITTTDLSNSEPNTIIIPDNGYWLSLTQSDSRDMSGWMMVEGDTYPSEYVSGYPKWVAEPSSVSGTTNGKTIAFMGDSITAGVAAGTTYHQYLHSRYGLKCLNYGYGGSGYYKNNNSYGSGRLGTGNEGIGDAITSENYFTPNNVVARLAELSSLTQLDGIVIFAGTNDYGNSISIENYISGIESAFTYCQTNYPAVPVLVLTPIHRKGDTEANDVGKTLSEYVDILIEECRKFGIAYIDTMTMTGIHPDNDNNKATFFTIDTSGLHPGPAGHKRIASVVGETLKQVISCNDF